MGYKYESTWVEIFDDDSDEVLSFAGIEYDSCIEVDYESPKE